MEALIWLLLYYPGARFRETYGRLYILTVPTINPVPSLKEGS